MKPRDLDWNYLGQGMTTVLVLAVVALSAFGVSAWWRSGVASGAEDEQALLAGLEQQRAELASRVAARTRHEARYQEIDAAGIIGEEQRLEWAQVLRDSATGLGLPYLRFNAAPRRAFEPPWLEPGVAAPVTATDMELQAGLVHELDLLRLLARLREEAPGYVAVNGCSLERAGGDLPPQPDKANITGACQLRWYSIHLPSAAMAAEGAP